MLQKFNRFIEKRMAFVTPTCLVLGILFSEIAEKGLAYTTYVFAFMTFAGSLKSRFRDVAASVKNFKPLVTMMLLIHLVMPALACGVGHLFFAGNVNLITGMVLEFSVPTAVTALMWVSIYHGNNSMSLSLVVLDTILAPFVIPAVLHLLVGSKVQMDAVSMMRDLIFMVALPALTAMCVNEFTDGKAGKTWTVKLAPFSKLALMYVVVTNSSKVAPYVKSMNAQRIAVATLILILAAGGYALGWLAADFLCKDRASIVSMVYGTGMRNISTGAVIAAEYFPGEVMFPVMIGTLFQQVLAALYGKLLMSRIPEEAE